MRSNENSFQQICFGLLNYACLILWGEKQRVIRACSSIAVKEMGEIEVSTTN